MVKKVGFQFSNVDPSKPCKYKDSPGQHKTLSPADILWKKCCERDNDAGLKYKHLYLSALKEKGVPKLNEAVINLHEARISLRDQYKKSPVSMSDCSKGLRELEDKMQQVTQTVFLLDGNDEERGLIGG